MAVQAIGAFDAALYDLKAGQPGRALDIQLATQFDTAIA